MRARLTELGRVVGRLREERRPARFVASRVLLKSRLCEALRLHVRVGDDRIVFRPSAMAANLWCDPGGYATDGTITTIGLLVRPGDVFVDVGAHIGLHTIAGSRASGPSGRVISLEPHPVTSRWLRENVQLNDLENVTVHAAAAGVANGRAAFSDRPLEDRNALEHDGSLLVEVVRLDDLLGDVDRVRLLKIDVEGSELDVLAGATAVLQRTDAVLVEAWSEHDVRSVLADFDTEVHSTGPGYVNLLAQRRAPGTQRP